MIDDLDFMDLLNAYNLIGGPAGSLVVPNLNIHQDSSNDYVVSYSFFQTAQDITDAGYYNFSGGPSENAVSVGDYRADIETAIQTI